MPKRFAAIIHLTGQRRALLGPILLLLGACGGGGGGGPVLGPPATGGNGLPTPGSVAAVTQTANSNAQCTAIQPFYWELGNADTALASGSSTQAGGTPVTAATRWPIASASKWIYGMYVVQKRGGAANLTLNDIRFLHFTSGYTYMDTSTSSATCTAPPVGPNSINPTA